MTPRRFGHHVPVALLALGLAVLAILSFGFGRYAIDPRTVLRVLLGSITGGPRTWSTTEQAVILGIRPPVVPELSPVHGPGKALDFLKGRMSLSANRHPPRIKSGAGFFGIMPYSALRK